MTYATIRGKNGRRHEVDFGDSPVRLEVYASEATIKIFVEADFESLPEERRRFALIKCPVNGSGGVPTLGPGRNDFDNWRRVYLMSAARMFGLASTPSSFRLEILVPSDASGVVH